MNKNNVLYKLFHRYFIVALNGMALGLFCTLIIGLIIKQIAINLSGSLSSFLLVIASIAMALTGPVIGIGVAHALKAPKLVILASGVVGFLGAFGSSLGTNNLLDQGKLIISRYYYHSVCHNNHWRNNFLSNRSIFNKRDENSWYIYTRSNGITAVYYGSSCFCCYGDNSNITYKFCGFIYYTCIIGYCCRRIYCGMCSSNGWLCSNKF